MTYTKIIAATASLTSLIALAAAPALAETTSLKPLHAASLKIGSEHAVGYFTSQNGRCNLVVSRAGERNRDQRQLHRDPLRILNLCREDDAL